MATGPAFAHAEGAVGALAVMEAPLAGFDAAATCWGRAETRHGASARSTGCAIGVLLIAGVGCRESHRIGDHVLVEYDGRVCPGYVIDRKSDTRLRIHFDFEGYDWQDEVSADRVLSRVKEAVQECPLPERVRSSLGLAANSKTAARASPYRVGDRVRVRWRESVYPAAITEVRATDTVVVHYLGHEDVWDEAIHIDRIETERP